MPTVPVLDAKGQKAGTLDLKADVFGVEIRISVDEHASDAKIPTTRRLHKRGFAIAVFRVDFCTLLDEQPNNNRVACTRRPHQRGSAIMRFFRVDIRPVFDKQLCDVGFLFT